LLLSAACDSLIEGELPLRKSPTEHSLADSLIFRAVLNMEALGGSEQPTSSSVHTLNLSGIVSGGGGKVLCRCRMTYSSGTGVTLELGVRAEQESACRLVIGAI
jgi:coatomer protein complex subunit gamma